MTTITDIPHNLRLYTAAEKTWSLPTDLRCDFFLSFEDALWALIEMYALQDQTILVPDFYCFDVVDNMKAHGLVVQTYRMHKDLTVDVQSFRDAVAKYSPAIVVIFHPVGIQSGLVESVGDMDSNIFVIEDSVHRVVDPSRVEIVHDKHLVIDSWRKVMPLQGSMMLRQKLVTSSEFLVSRKDHYSFMTWAYSAKVLSLWVGMVVAAKLRQGKLAQKLMLRGYDVIGDNDHPARPPGLLSHFRRYTDYAYIRKVKAEQMRQYDEVLHELIISNNFFFPIQFSQSDWSEMRAYPVGLELTHGDEVIAKLRARGLLVRAELNDSPWSQQQKVIYLPLGPEIDVECVVEIFRETIRQIS